MFFSKVVAAFAVAVAAVSVGARPFPMPLQKAGVVNRGEQAVRNTEQVVGAVTIIDKRQSNVNKIPAEIPTQSKNGVIEPFQGGDVTKRQVEVQNAAMSLDGNDIVPFKNTGRKRQVEVQEAAMSLDGNAIVPFKNTGKKRQVEVQNAAMSLDGNTIVPFKNTGKKRQVEVQEAAMSLDGNAIVPFQNTGKRSVEPEAEVVEKRQPKINTFPTWIAARSDGGEIVAF